MKQKLLFLVAVFLICLANTSAQQLRVAVAGLTHDHIHGILREFNEGKVTIVGIVEKDKQLQLKYGKQYHLPDSLFFNDLKALIQLKKPAAVLAYNAVGEHLSVVQICAPLGIHVMVEKPLAATYDQAKQIASLAAKHNIRVLTNYETTWYPSVHDIYDAVKKDSIGSIKRMVVHDGHQGPKEIGCSPAFLQWLTDPILNGAGALNDFGCYGADLMTMLMNGARPVAVTAITRQYKPSVYPNVDDDATIIVEYAGATGLIEASWNWPYSIKDMEVFGETGYYHALDGKNIMVRMRENNKSSRLAKPLEPPYTDAMTYLKAVVNNQIPGDNDLSSLKYNLIVMEILDAAKRSASAGKRIILPH